MGIFYNLSKVIELVPFILIIDETSQNDVTESILSKFKKIRDFKAYFVCILLKILTKFSVDPYYEPLLRFMVETIFSENSQLIEWYWYQ